MKNLAAQGLTMLVVTHEMRIAQDVSTRVFYMDQGEVWEQGPPSQIFENPLRKETHDFIFRVRNWNWEVDALDFDFPAMVASLEAFCARQFLGRRLSYALQIALEELLMICLLPAAERHGIAYPGIKTSISIAEGGEAATLEADCRALMEAGVDLGEAAESLDEISSALLEQILSVHSLDEENGTVTYTVG